MNSYNPFLIMLMRRPILSNDHTFFYSRKGRFLLLLFHLKLTDMKRKKGKQVRIIHPKTAFKILTVVEMN